VGGREGGRALCFTHSAGKAAEKKQLVGEREKEGGGGKGKKKVSKMSHLCHLYYLNQ